MPGESQPIQLAYADAPARHGIVFEPAADGFTIRFPARGNERRAAQIILGCIGTVILLALRIGSVASIVGVGFLAAAASFVVIPLVLLFQQREPMRIVLSAETLLFANVIIPGEDQSPDVTFPRAAIYEVKHVEHSGNLFVRGHGCDMFDFPISKDPAISRWIALALREALHLR